MCVCVRACVRARVGGWIAVEGRDVHRRPTEQQRWVMLLRLAMMVVRLLALVLFACGAQADIADKLGCTVDAAFSTTCALVKVRLSADGGRPYRPATFSSAQTIV